MPYNNAPIPPASEVTGSTALPLSRVKKIINADEDTGSCSNNAAFAIAIATEMFVQHLVEQTHVVVKSERRPRRNIQYKDVANAVARIDNLEFLSDVVPRTMTFKQFKEKKAKEKTTQEGPALANGQKALKRTTEPEERNEDGLTTEDAAATRVSPTSPNRHPDRTSRASGGAGSRARHTYDAVRNGFHNEREDTIPMEED